MVAMSIETRGPRGVHVPVATVALLTASLKPYTVDGLDLQTDITSTLHTCQCQHKISATKINEADESGIVLYRGH